VSEAREAVCVAQPESTHGEDVKSAKASVIGQAICDEVALLRRAWRSSGSKPLGAFLFAGPPGTGKTHLNHLFYAIAQALSAEEADQ